MTATGSARERAWEEMDERQPTADLARDGSRHLRRGYENRASVRASPLHQPLLVPTTTLPLLPPPFKTAPPLHTSARRTVAVLPSKTAEVALAGLHVAFPALAASRSSAKASALPRAW